MTPARNVQFKDVDSVVQAYENWRTPAFAIWCGKQFLFRYCGSSISDGSDELRQWLGMLYENGTGSAGIYTLAVYEDLPEDGKIKSNTHYDGSFNFRLNELPYGFVQGQPGGQNVLLSRIAALEKQLKEKDEEDDTYGMGQLGLILQHPAIEPLVPVLTNKLMDWVLDENKTPQKIARISGVKLDAPLEMPADIQQRVNQAMDILFKDDPEFSETLWKMAQMKLKQPKKYGIYCQAFKLMKI